MNWLYFLPYTIPIGMSGVLIFVSIMAQQGKSFWGTRVMLGTAIATLLSSMLLLAVQIWLDHYLRTSGFGPNYRKVFQVTENLALGGLLTMGSALLGFSIGFLAITCRWLELKKRSLELESLAKKLTSDRDGVTTPVLKDGKVNFVFPES